MKTSASYVKEYALFDAVLESIANGQKDVYEASVAYESVVHRLNMMSFFEASDDVAKNEASEKKKNIFERIGAQVMKIVKAVTDFIANLGEKLGSLFKITKTDEEKVNQMLKDHPELKNQVIEGVSKNWFSVKDVAAYEKDVLGLCEMLKKHQMDNKTFMQKISEAAAKFNESAAPIVGTVTTVASILGAVGLIKKKTSESKSALDALKKKFESFGREVKDNKEYKDDSTASAIFHALSDLIHARTQDCNDHVSMIKKTNGIFGKIINSKVGKTLKINDDSREERYFDKKVGQRMDSQNRKEKNEEYENKIREKADNATSH